MSAPRSINIATLAELQPNLAAAICATRHGTPPEDYELTLGQWHELNQMRYKQIGRGRDRFVSRDATERRIKKNLRQKSWLEDNFITTDSGELLSMEQVAKTAGKRGAKLYTMLVGLERFAKKLGLVPFFLTITLPPEYHPNPTTGGNKWDGLATPRDGHIALMQRHQDFGRRYGKVLGWRVGEIHDDGCPHWHMLVFLPNDTFEINRFKEAFETYYLDGEEACTHKTAKGKKCTCGNHRGQFLKIELAEKAAPGKATQVATYMLPYVLKQVAADGADYEQSDDPIESAREWRCVWGGIRGYQFSGLPRGAATLWDEFRRIDCETDKYKTLTATGQALVDVAQGKNTKGRGDFCQFLELLAAAQKKKEARAEEGRATCLIRKPRDTPARSIKIVGFECEGVQTLTHEKSWEKIDRMTAEELANSPKPLCCKGWGVRHKSPRGAGACAPIREETSPTSEIQGNPPQTAQPDHPPAAGSNPNPIKTAQPGRWDGLDQPSIKPRWQLGQFIWTWQKPEGIDLSPPPDRSASQRALH